MANNIFNLTGSKNKKNKEILARLPFPLLPERKKAPVEQKKVAQVALSVKIPVPALLVNIPVQVEDIVCQEELVLDIPKNISDIVPPSEQKPTKKKKRTRERYCDLWVFVFTVNLMQLTRERLKSRFTSVAMFVRINGSILTSISSF